MKVKRYGSSVALLIGNKVTWLPIPLYRILHRPFWAYILKYTDDADCDGSHFIFTDRLTNGKIYYRSIWNYSRSGGSIGDKTTWFNF